jgi:hypothetical protein
MKRIKKVVVLSFTILCLLPNMANAAREKNRKNLEKIDWNPVIEAIIMVESGGNRFAKSGRSVGAMQITPILVSECNRILKKRNRKKKFTLADRYSVKKSKEMFLLIQSFHNPANNIEQAIRSWNGGLTCSAKRTQRYYNKVMREMKKAK